MGEQRVSKLTDKKQMDKFVSALLKDVQALEYMLEKDMFDKGITRIGAEQEMVLVDKKDFRAAPMAMEALELLKEHEWCETEIAKFNLETNLDPRVLEGSCFSDLEKENREKLIIIEERIQELGLNIVLTGILPTFVKSDLDIENLTPKKRYKALVEAINEQLNGRKYELKIKGIDELRITHDSPLIEACNTSFQVHLQIEPDDFVKMYNIAQAITGPVLAIAANSPLVFGKKLWHESRIAMFQQSIDTRSSHNHIRDKSPRVSFGNRWLKDSIMEIYREDISRFRVLLSADIDEDSIELLKDGKIPKLRALQVHNSTVYRWNRPCYGVSDNGKPHLRIENRVFGAGPTVKDELANAVFWIGLMLGMAEKYDDITKELSFEDVHDNFEKAARFGIDTTFSWIDDKKVSATDLILNELVPIARKGLTSKGVDKKDIDAYLGIIEERARLHMNGARWILRSYMKLKGKASQDEVLSTITHCMVENQKTSKPLHEWDMPEISDLKSYNPRKLKVSGFMETDLFTVRSEDLIELVAEMMDWKKIKYTPVENKDGSLAGLVSSRLLLRHFIRTNNSELKKFTTVEDIMIKDPVSISPLATIMDAMKIMKEKNVGCLPVVDGKELVGIITEQDFIAISRSLLERE
jgi:CBS domain-containing protein/gamma-glutamylcysteine synthetase